MYSSKLNYKLFNINININISDKVYLYGKGNKRKNNGKKTSTFVSDCIPTFNRRPFIKSMIACFDHQLYPRDKMEWIIIDDGTDPIEDLVANHPNVKIF